jgi:hypothetical protein
MTNPKYGKIVLEDVATCPNLISQNMVKPGTNPLVTISANESNCKPSGPATFHNLAKKPSKKSKNIPKHTK